MKKMILAMVMIAVTATTAFSKTDVPASSVKLGSLVNGEIKLTYDVPTLKKALGIMVAPDNQEIDETALFTEDGKYFLWGSVIDKTTKESKGKLVFQIEKDNNNNLQLIAKPIYVLKCVAVSNCVECRTMSSTCYCLVSSSPSPGDCEWKKVLVDDGTALYDRTFQELLKNQN